MSLKWQIVLTGSREHDVIYGMYNSRSFFLMWVDFCLHGKPQKRSVDLQRLRTSVHSRNEDPRYYFYPSKCKPILVQMVLMTLTRLVCKVVRNSNDRFMFFVVGSCFLDDWKQSIVTKFTVDSGTFHLALQYNSPFGSIESLLLQRSLLFFLRFSSVLTFGAPLRWPK